MNKKILNKKDKIINETKIVNNKKVKAFKIGGMATFGGVLLKSKTKQVVTYKSNNNLSLDVTNFDSNKIINNIWIVRGIFAIFSSIRQGIPHIIKSAEGIINNIVKDKTENISIKNIELVISFIISAIIFLVIWVIIPIHASLIIPTTDLRWILQVIIKTSFFVIYLSLIKKLTYLDELFQYHGAEHKVINYYEDNVNEVHKAKSILDIDLDKVANYSRFHKRCGSNYLMHLFILSIITTIVIPSSAIWTKIFLEIITFPILLGLAYETLNIVSYIPKRFDSLIYPTMYIQKITTKIPTKDKLEIAVASLLEIKDKHISVRGYIKQYINKYLKKVKITENDIMRLISYTLKISTNDLHIILDSKKLNLAEQINIKKVLDRYYIMYEPLQYIIGIQPLYKEEYMVNKNVLIPRPDTEILIETAINYINYNNLKIGLDLCTGSGAVGISIAKNSDIEKMLLSDISKKALEVAKINIDNNNVTSKCNTVQSDLFNAFIQNKNKFDIVVINPPYIKSDEIATLSKYVQKEPLIALNGGINGLDYYIKIFKEAEKILNNNSYVIIEIGYNQKNEVINIINENPKFKVIETVKDLSSNERVIVCHFH